MLELPNHVLEKLQCAKCGGYLSCGPIVIDQDLQQLCGRCFKILPDDVKSRCVRQIGLEAVAEVLIFPCRYRVQGCIYTFPYDSGGEHELMCQHRGDSIKSNRSCSGSIKSNSSTISRGYTPQAKHVEVKVNCGSPYSVDGEDKLKLSVGISGKDTHKLSLSGYNTDIKLNLEVVVSLQDVPKITYSHHFIEKRPQEPIYESVKFIMHKIACPTCQKYIVYDEIFHCPSGHSICKACKSVPCGICGVLATSNSQHYCRNYVKGCTNLFPTGDIPKHETDCEFNDFKCPSCDFCDILSLMVAHFVQKHEVVLANELVVTLGRKDQQWFFYCYDRLFRCRFYNFDEGVEFVVVYVGCHDGACKYKYEVALTSNNQNSVKKSSGCLGWNEASLGRAVGFEVAVRKNVQARITILSNDVYYNVYKNVKSK
ncbi:hypothetical protein Zmor_000239 [Zophobas morio]|uniref:SIAH-type domain-containing protein n=1 Tax=Zophobas morio TaxID=2755281 RepID=A0AA38MRB9_9CUCU|nr:hypothetical protein Zmor_000239 [Zophobas morio]